MLPFRGTAVDARRTLRRPALWWATSWRPALRRPRVLAAIAAFLLVIAAFGSWVGATAKLRRGTAAPHVRTTVELGRRAVAVAEPEAVLAWEVDGTGATRVRQDRGDVFYRVDDGTSFTVATPMGEVGVDGTCFRVVIDWDRGVVDVVVLEGEVQLRRDDRTISLVAGEAGTLRREHGPRRVEP